MDDGEKVETSSQVDDLEKDLPALLPTPEIPIEYNSNNFSWSYYEINSSRCEEQVHNFIKHKLLPPLVERPQLAQYLKRRSCQEMINGNYNSAQYYKEISNKYSQACRDSMKDMTDSFQINKINEEIAFLNENKQKIISECNTEYKDLKYKFESQKDLAFSQRQNEIQQFTEKWEDPKALYPYSRPTPKLIELRNKEKLHIIAKEYDEAKRIKTFADKVEKEETKIAQANVEKIMQSERDQIESRYNLAIENLERRFDQCVSKIKMQSNNKINIINKRIEKLQSDIEFGYFPEPKTGTYDADTLNSRCPMALTTPRTRNKISQFKKTPVAKKIMLQPINQATHVALPLRGRIRIPKLAMSR